MQSFSVNNEIAFIMTGTRHLKSKCLVICQNNAWLYRFNALCTAEMKSQEMEINAYRYIFIQSMPKA